MDLEQAAESELWAASVEGEGAARGEVLHELGSRLFRRGAFEQAAAASETAAGLFADSGLPRQEAFARYGLGLSLQRLRRHEESAATFEAAGELFRAAGDEFEIANCAESAGQVLDSFDRPTQALAAWATAVGLFASFQAYGRAADVCLQRGELFGRADDFDAALAEFTRARGWFRAEGNGLAVAHTDDRIAAALIELGRVGEAVEKLRAVLDFRAAGRDAAALAHARYRLGWTLTMTPDGDQEALSHLESARAEFVALDDTLAVGRCDLYAGAAMSNTGRYDDAKDCCVRARAVFDAHGADHDLLLAETSLAVTLDRSGHTEQAAARNRRVVEMAREAGDGFVAAGAAVRLARNLLDLDRPQEALDALDAVNGPVPGGVEEQARHLLVRALAGHRTGHAAPAREVAGQVLELLADTDSNAQRAEAHALLGDLDAAAGDHSTAGEHRATAVALYLADGYIARATETSRHLLPAQRNRPTDEPRSADAAEAAHR